jgi:predicted Zn-dependent protease
MKNPSLVLALSLFVFATAPMFAQQTQSDVIARAMQDEMQRSMKELHIEGQERPYFISYKIVDRNRIEAHASLGALTSSGESHNRYLTVTVRVGGYDLDNSNYNGGIGAMIELLGSLGGGGNVLPLDDNYDELRRKLWLATDAAYKKAVEDLSAKKAANQNRNRTETVPSFSHETPQQESETLQSVDAKLVDAEGLVRDASAVFRKLPSVETATAEFEVNNNTERFLNSEGTTYFRQVPEIYFHASASLQDKTGENFIDTYSAYARSLNTLPSRAELVASTREISDRLLARMKGKSSKRYSGPVLVEGRAANELFARYFAVSLLTHRSASTTGSLLDLLTGNEADNASSTTNLLNKISSRVLPDFLTVDDNPRLTQLDGQPLFGSYKFDEEGVPSQETTLVKDGILKTLLTSRTPVRGIHQSSGNMREAGVQPGNLFVTASTSSTREDLRKQLIDLIKTRGLDYGIIVRQLSGVVAIEAARIYPDGHEEALRNAKIAEVTPASFKDILAVSKDRTVYSERVQGAASYADADLVSYIVPDMLFEDMTIERKSDNTPKPPVISNPIDPN